MAVAVETLGRKTEERQPSFFDAISKSDLKEILTPRTPWVSISMEVAVDQLPFTGGMGILEGDKLLQAEKSQVPWVVVTLAYSERWRQRIENLSQRELFEKLEPEDLGLERVAMTTIKTNGDTVSLDICRQQGGSVEVIALYEPNLRELYYGSNDDQHRLYQEVVLGFGGHNALKVLTLEPAVLHLNESAKVFSAVAYLDKLMGEGVSFEEALARTRSRTLLTNHTLVPAAVSAFSSDLYERYVFPNIKTPQVRDWIERMIDGKGGYLDLDTLALELAGRVNGVSRVHSRVASKSFRRLDGSLVHFEPITNGIFLERWTDPRYLNLYRESGIIDEHDLPGKDYGERIGQLDNQKLRAIKREARNDLSQYLERRVNQYGRSVQILPDAKIAVWARRFADYKRPGMIFSDQQALAEILESENIHLIIAGKAHPTDYPMKDELREILAEIDGNSMLRERVHFVQDYDEELSRHLVTGADIWLNTPKVGQEACGTSPWKAIVNLTRVISTRDGGLADVDPSYLVIQGEDYGEEIEMLYFRLVQAAAEIDDLDRWGRVVKEQLRAYLPTISGGRMLQEYIDFVFTPAGSSFQSEVA